MPLFSMAFFLKEKFMNIQSVILFDGVCNFCNSSVNFIIKEDKKQQFRFAALQSIAGQQLLEQYHLPIDSMQSIVLIENGKAYLKSTAILRICKRLKNLWPVCYVFIVIPAKLRDLLYELISNNRYKWFGKNDECMVPDSNTKNRFLQ